MASIQRADGITVGSAPGFGCVGGLDGVHEGNVEELHDGVVEGVDVLSDGMEMGDGFGAGDVMSEKSFCLRACRLGT